MLQIAFEDVEEAALAALVVNQVAEGRDLDYKRDLPGNSDEDKKEFLADVTAMANAQGGDLIFGIEEEGGTAIRVVGCSADLDAEILRLDQIMRAGIAPRIIGVRLRRIPLTNGRAALLIRVPASLSAPHRITFKNSGRFYSRNSAGKYEMDVQELRQAFIQADSLPQRFRELHNHAIEASGGVGMPFVMKPSPRAIVTIAPLSLFREERDFPVSQQEAVVPYWAGGISANIMIEGMLLYIPPQDDDGVLSWALTHRVGRLDAAWTIGGEWKESNGDALVLAHSKRFEDGLAYIADAARTRLTRLGLSGPWIIMASVQRAMNASMSLGDWTRSRPSFRDEAFLGQLVLEDISEEALIPLAQTFWRLFGEERPAGKPLERS